MSREKPPALGGSRGARPRKAAAPDPQQIEINPDLVWDYEMPPMDRQDEAFRRWYIARVLTRGRSEDLKAIGLATIHRYLPVLVLPAKIRRFWEWYLGFSDVKERHGIADPSPEEGPRGDR